MTDSYNNLNIPTYSSLINNNNFFINTFGNMISKEDLKLLLESRNMFTGIDVKEFIETTFGEHLNLCKFFNDNIETCVCFHFVVQQYRVKILKYRENQKKKIFYCFEFILDGGSIISCCIF